MLISSNICRYAEFRAVDKIVTLLNGKVTAVPCSRADVFTNKNVNVVEKRLLMKALGNCLNANDDADTDAKFKKFGDKTFVEYLQSERLTPNLIHYVLYAIAMCDDQTSCAVGVKRTKQFLQSLGRYGNTPFLFPMYGCGEIPQCFCRLCAVFGGVYCLKRSIDTIRIDEVQNDFRSVSCGGQTINAKALVLGNGGRIGNAAKSIRFTANDSIETTPNEVNKCGQLARAIYIVTKPLGDESLNSGGGGVNILRLPGSSKTNDGAFVIQLAHYSGTCPKDLCKFRSTTHLGAIITFLHSLFVFFGTDLIHITCKASGTSPAQDIHPFERQLFDDTNENTILWSMYFNIPQCMKCQHSTDKNSANVHIACGPFFELDYDESIQQAKTTFNEIYPNDEFLPRAPDPEEIIIEGDAAPTTPTSETALVNSALIDGIDTLQIDATDSSMGHSDTTCTDTATSDTATSDTMGTDTATSDTTCTDSGTAGCDSGSTYCSDSYGDTSCGDSGGGSYD